MDVNKNSYTFGFALILVVVVGALLSITATSLKPMQAKNVSLEKKQNILKSIGVDVSREEADVQYPNYIKKELVISNGQVQEGTKAFDVDMAKQVKETPEDRLAPLYMAEKDGVSYYIVPVRGKGLWGPIWGYISLGEDANTIVGAIFDHKTETPGLGAEINTADFMNQFKDKKILDAQGNLVSIEVRKGDASGDYQVDGISGGTITSVGVQDMLADCLKSYVDFLEESTASTASTFEVVSNELATIEQ